MEIFDRHGNAKAIRNLPFGGKFLIGVVKNLSVRGFIAAWLKEVGYEFSASLRPYFLSFSLKV